MTFRKGVWLYLNPSTHTPNDSAATVLAWGQANGITEFYLQYPIPSASGADPATVTWATQFRQASFFANYSPRLFALGGQPSDGTNPSAGVLSTWASRAINKEITLTNPNPGPPVGPYNGPLFDGVHVDVETWSTWPTNGPGGSFNPSSAQMDDYLKCLLNAKNAVHPYGMFHVDLTPGLQLVHCPDTGLDLFRSVLDILSKIGSTPQDTAFAMTYFTTAANLETVAAPLVTDAVAENVALMLSQQTFPGYPASQTYYGDSRSTRLYADQNSVMAHFSGSTQVVGFAMFDYANTKGLPA